ncbi:MAG: ferrous iron transport protein B [Phycisphaerae bacterium]|jgi:ferrous iron transport protein B
MSKHHLTVALAGNPNCGKSSLFNCLTGLRQHTGNYPGVTVERKEGTCRHGRTSIRLVDLPGTYSLSAYSDDELVARRFILQQHPDVIVNVVDSSNLQRGLYLCTQLLDCGIPMVVALNMADVAEATGCHVDVEHLSRLLGLALVWTTASKGKGISELLDAIVEAARPGRQTVLNHCHVDYGREVEGGIERLADMITKVGHNHLPSRWQGIKLLENDAVTRQEIVGLAGEASAPLLAEADRLREEIEASSGQSAEVVLAGKRHEFVGHLCEQSVRRGPQPSRSLSDRIDTVVTHRYLGLPLFAVMMFLVFQLTFLLGDPVVRVLDGWKGQLAQAVWSVGGTGEGSRLLKSLLADGVIEGVGAVLQFVPLIALMFLAISILEDSGYMARAAFVLDHLMHHVGLHGKSFIPLLIGFGCTVPAVMATRMLESRRDRLTTMMVLPLMSCGARLPVYLLILGAFFANHVVFKLFGLVPVTTQGLLLLLIYAIGIILAVLLTRLLRATVFRGAVSSFVMEMPPYRLPAPRDLAIHTASRTWMYVRKAGTVILAMSILLWALKTWPQASAQQTASFQAQRAALLADAGMSGQARTEAVAQLDMRQHRAQLESSCIGRIGRAVAPVMAPCGFDWKVSASFLGAVAAKEVFVSQMGVIYAVGDHEGQEMRLQAKLAADYTPLQGFCIMLFCLICAPCMGTVVVTMNESASWKWALLQWGGLTAVAWLVTTGVYQGISRLWPLLWAAT